MGGPKFAKFHFSILALGAFFAPGLEVHILHATLKELYVVTVSPLKT